MIKGFGGVDGFVASQCGVKSRFPALNRIKKRCEEKERRGLVFIPGSWNEGTTHL